MIIKNVKTRRTIGTIVTIALCSYLGVGVFCFYLVIIPPLCHLFVTNRMHHAYSYKIGVETPEYVTFERVGEKSYKISFHPTPDVTGEDYLMITNYTRILYPTLQWTYLEGEDNRVLLRNNECAPFKIDTIVSDHYHFIPTHDLLRSDTVKTFDDILRYGEWRDSLGSLPYRYWAFVQGWNRIDYADPNAKTYEDFKEPEVVKVGTK